MNDEPQRQSEAEQPDPLPKEELPQLTPVEESQAEPSTSVQDSASVEESMPVEDDMPDDVPSGDETPPEQPTPSDMLPPAEDLASSSPAEPPPFNEPDASAGRFFPPTWALLVLLLGIILVVAVALGVLRQTWFTSQPEGDAEPLSVDKLATFNSPPELPQDTQILQENGAPLSTALPNDLVVQGLRYPVVPAPLEGGRWPVPAEQDDVAVWVYGTVVNYVIGLPYTTTIESRLAGLVPGATITLTLSNGNALVFGSPQARRYAATDTSPLSQAQPGLTLVLLGPPDEGTERLVVTARYLPDASPAGGGVQQIGDLEVQVLESRIAGQSADGQDFIVEYAVTQQGDVLVETNLFDFILEDGDGQRYATNAAISQQGEYGSLPAQFGPGETVQASAGYRIPRDVQPPLTWIFRADATSAETARFSLAYEPPLAGPPQPQVELTEAFADQDREAIVLNGLVRNTGESSLSVTEEQVGLSSSAGAADLIVATPPLPWQIEAGGEQIIELQFVRPSGVDSVLLDVLGFTFQIDGLP